MAEDEVGSLAEELQLLAIAISAQDPDAPDSILGLLREHLGGDATPKPQQPDIERIDLS